MKIKITFPENLILLILLTFFSISNAQVGINTTTPAGGSILDIESADKGMLVPRIDILDLATIAPITGGAPESLLVWNTNTSTGVGFHYWDGIRWVSLDPKRFWRLDGNSSTIPGTNVGQDFIGTSDNTDLIIATDSSEKLIIPANSDQLFAADRGSNSRPFYSWEQDFDTGIWSSGGDRINFTAGTREMLEMREAGSISNIVFNDGGQDTDIRMESENQQNIFFLNAEEDQIIYKKYYATFRLYRPTECIRRWNCWWHHRHSIRNGWMEPRKPRRWR